MSKGDTTKTFIESMIKFLNYNIAFGGSGKEQNSWAVLINVINGSSFAPFEILTKV